MLRARGFDAVSVHEIGAAGLSDEEQLRRATADHRVLLTSNYQDFIRIFSDWLAAGQAHSGIVISYHQYSRDQLRLLAVSVQRLLNTLSAEDLDNSLQALDAFRAT